MPPRARKTAAPAPSLENGADTPPEQPEAEETTDSAASADEIEQLPDGEFAAVSGPAENVPEGSIQLGDGSAPDPSQDNADQETETDGGQHAAVEPAFHWESVKNDGTAPCHLCVPGGPPAGAGTFGCSHGQWVRVVDHPTD